MIRMTKKLLTRLSKGSGEFLVKASFDELELYDPVTDYSLLIRFEPVLPMHQVVFHKRLSDSMNLMSITARDIDEYASSIQHLLDSGLNPKFQYIGVGAGLGAFIPRLLKKLKQSSNSYHKPIVIDFADYNVMKSLLLEADSLLPRLEHRLLGFSLLELRVNELIDRCELMLGDEVVLYNMHVCEAVNHHKELLHSADVVVDHIGAVSYATNKKQVLECEGKLLKHKGELLVF